MRHTNRKPVAPRASQGAPRLQLFDWSCLVYVTLIGLGVLVFRNRVPTWPRDLAVHAAMAAAILGIIRLHRRLPRNRWIAGLRLLYPVGCMAYGWNELDRLVPMVFGSYWATSALMWADRAIFGCPPTEWFRARYTPVMDELMNVCYFGYYLFMPLVCASLLLRGKRRELTFVLSIVTFTYFTTFLLYYLFPALAPRMVPGLADAGQGDYTGYLFASLTRTVQSNGAIHGACFPSSHVAGAFAWTFAANRVDRRLGLVLAPVAAGVALATVYLRYHHAVDSLAGLLVGLACTRIAVGLVGRAGQGKGGAMTGLPTRS